MQHEAPGGQRAGKRRAFLYDIALQLINGISLIGSFAVRPPRVCSGLTAGEARRGSNNHRLRRRPARIDSETGGNERIASFTAILSNNWETISSPSTGGRFSSGRPERVRRSKCVCVFKKRGLKAGEGREEKGAVEGGFDTPTLQPQGQQAITKSFRDSAPFLTPMSSHKEPRKLQGSAKFSAGRQGKGSSAPGGHGERPGSGGIDPSALFVLWQEVCTELLLFSLLFIFHEFLKDTKTPLCPQNLLIWADYCEVVAEKKGESK